MRKQALQTSSEPTWGGMNPGTLTSTTQRNLCWITPNKPRTTTRTWRKLMMMRAHWNPRKSNTCFSRTVIWWEGWGSVGAERRGRAPDDNSPCQLRQCCPGLYSSHKVVFFILRSCHSNWAVRDKARGGGGSTWLCWIISSWRGAEWETEGEDREGAALHLLASVAKTCYNGFILKNVHKVSASINVEQS